MVTHTLKILQQYPPIHWRTVKFYFKMLLLDFHAHFLLLFFEKSIFKGLISKKGYINRELWKCCSPLLPPPPEGLVLLDVLSNMCVAIVCCDVIFIIFKGLLVAKNGLRSESVPLGLLRTFFSSIKSRTCLVF